MLKELPNSIRGTMLQDAFEGMLHNILALIPQDILERMPKNILFSVHFARLESS